MKEDFIVINGVKKVQDGFTSAYQRGIMVVLLIKMGLFALFAVLLQFSCWRNLLNSAYNFGLQNLLL